METKQTAVEWLMEQLKFINKEAYADLYEGSFGVAKRMEKEQIAEAFNNSYWFIDGQQYYEKTYGK